jgi:hypothetical protein
VKGQFIMPDLMATGDDLGTQYVPSETSGVYHEDREVTVTGGPGSQMFRVYGAKFSSTSGLWTLQSGVSVAYATVQNPDGSIHYFTQSDSSGWSNSEWLGSSNNTVYNAEDYGLSTGGSASSNSTALTSLFTAMPEAAGLGGGTGWIPQYNFQVNAWYNPSTGFTGPTVPPQSIFQGLGTGGKNDQSKFHFSINDPGEGPNIFLYCSGHHTSGGTYFEKLAFQWNTPGYTNDTCLYLNTWSNTARDCTFTDCPTAVNIQGLGCLLDHCTISYGDEITTPTNVTAVVMAGISCEIAGPSEFNGESVGGTSTCITIGGGASTSNECTIRRIHIDAWSYGIDYSDINGTGTKSGTQDNVISDCVMACTITCVNLTPQSTGGAIFNQKFVNNTITKEEGSVSGAPIVFIDSNGTEAANIGPIEFINNLIFSNVVASQGGVAQNNQYGVQIGTCGAVSIIGGQISQMGGNNGTTGSANICISGDPTYVLIDSVNLSAAYEGANAGGATGSTGSGPSYYGLLITGNPARVLVNNCNFAGLAVPISVSLSGEEEFVPVTVTNCPGYNDQNTVVNTLANIATGTPYSAATQGTNHGTSYFGPSFVMFTANAGASSFQYNGGAAQTLLPNQVVCLTLASANDTIQFDGHVPSAFTWMGK